MDTIELSYTFTHVPGVMTRGRHVLIMIHDHDGKYVLGSKQIYPEGIYRFVGGGVDEGEDMSEAAARELEEETGIVAGPGAFGEVATFVAHIHETSTGKHYDFETELYAYQLSEADEMAAADDLDDLAHLDDKEMLALIKRYDGLSKELDTSLGGDPISWSDYGKFYGKVHEVGYEWWKSRS